MYRQGTDSQTDGRTDELIWGGLGNLRFLQVNYLTCLVSTMASSGFGPYHGMYLEDAQIKCVGVIPTPCVMTHALGLVQFPPQHE